MTEGSATIGPLQTGDELVGESPGAMLRRLREGRQLSIAQVADRLKYGSRQIEALEADAFEKLPGLIFVRGMIRSYSRLLGAEPDGVLRLLDRDRIPDPMTVDLRVSKIPFPDGKRRVTRVYVGLSLAFAVVALAVWYELLPWEKAAPIVAQPTEKPQEEPKPETRMAPVEAPVSVAQAVLPAAAAAAHPTIPASVAPVPPQPAVIQKQQPEVAPKPLAEATASTKKIALQFDRESWVEIKQGNGKTLLSQLNPAGSRQVVEGIPPFVLIIGNAPSVHLSYNDQPVDLRPHFKVDVARFTLE